MTESGFIGIIFNNFFHFSGFMGMVACTIQFIRELFRHFWIYGYAFQKSFRDYCMCALSEIFPKLSVEFARFEWHNPAPREL